MSHTMTADRISKIERSALMAKIKSKNTAPELVVRQFVYSLGFRYRLHQKNLPGKPDLVLKNMGKIIFVHGCFWHGHSCPAGSNKPHSNLEYWSKKLYRNKIRDKNNIRSLKRMGWDVLILWECEIMNTNSLLNKLKSFLVQ